MSFSNFLSRWTLALATVLCSIMMTSKGQVAPIVQTTASQLRDVSSTPKSPPVLSTQPVVTVPTAKTSTISPKSPPVITAQPVVTVPTAKTSTISSYSQTSQALDAANKTAASVLKIVTQVSGGSFVAEPPEGPAKIICYVGGDLPITVTLYKGKEILETQKIIYGTSTLNATFDRNMTCEDSGNYSCLAHNAVSTKNSSKTGNIMVKCKPHQCSQKEVNVVGEVGQEVVVSVCVYGFPKPHVDGLYRDDRSVVNDTEYEIDVSGNGTPYWSVEVILKRFTSNKSMENFILNIRNTKGLLEVNATVTTITEARPKCPKSLNVSDISSTGVVLSWRAAFDGGQPQMFYVVRHDSMSNMTSSNVVKEIQDTKTFDGVMTARVSGLTPMTNYTFSVTSSNEHGNATGCGMIEITTNESLPVCPEYLKWTRISSTTVTFSWRAASEDSLNRPFLVYLLEFKDGLKTRGHVSGVQHTKLANGSMSGTITGLEPQTNYTFSVVLKAAEGYAQDWCDERYLHVLTSATTVPTSKEDNVDEAQVSWLTMACVYAILISLCIILAIVILIYKRKEKKNGFNIPKTASDKTADVETPNGDHVCPVQEAQAPDEDVALSTSSAADCDVITGRLVMMQGNDKVEYKPPGDDDVNQKNNTTAKTSDVTATNVSDVTETKNSDVTQTKNSDVTETKNSDVTKTKNSDVTDTTNADIAAPNISHVTETTNAGVAAPNISDVTETKNADVTAGRTVSPEGLIYVDVEVEQTNRSQDVSTDSNEQFREKPVDYETIDLVATKAFQENKGDGIAV